MSLNESLYELTERYLSGDLSPKEKIDYEKMLQENPALKTHMEKMKKLNELLFMEGLRAEIPLIRAAEKQYMFRQQWTQYGKWFGGILMIAVVATSVWVFSGSKKEKTTPAPVSNNSREQIISAPEKDNTPETISTTPKNTNPVTLYQVPVEQSTLAPVVMDGNTEVPPPLSEKQIRAMELERDTTTKGHRNETTPCAIKAEINTLPSCVNKNDGAIALEKISGRPPYKTNMSNRPYHENYITIRSLQADTYEVVITDSDGCSSGILKITVQEKNCIEKQDVVFSYSASGIWQFPETNEKSYSFHLYNKVGAELYSVNVVNGSPSSWDGYSSNGQKLPMGVYPYRFVKEGEIILEGSITVVE